MSIARIESIIIDQDKILDGLLSEENFARVGPSIDPEEKASDDVWYPNCLRAAKGDDARKTGAAFLKLALWHLPLDEKTKDSSMLPHRSSFKGIFPTADESISLACLRKAATLFLSVERGPSDSDSATVDLTWITFYLSHYFRYHPIAHHILNYIATSCKVVVPSFTTRLDCTRDSDDSIHMICCSWLFHEERFPSPFDADAYLKYLFANSPKATIKTPKQIQIYLFDLITKQYPPKEQRQLLLKCLDLTTIVGCIFSVKSLFFDKTKEIRSRLKALPVSHTATDVFKILAKEAVHSTSVSTIEHKDTVSEELKESLSPSPSEVIGSSSSLSKSGATVDSEYEILKRTGFFSEKELAEFMLIGQSNGEGFKDPSVSSSLKFG